MSPISLALNLLLAGLLLMTLLFGWILNRRLKALKDSHAGFANAVGDLDRAAQRAETGLMELRATTDQAVELLTGRIEKARELADRLETATLRAENAEKSVLARSAQARDNQIREFRAREAQGRGEAQGRAETQGRASESRASPAREPEAREPTAVRSIFDRIRPTAPAPTFRQTSDDEAEAAAEALILRLSEAEVLTTSASPPREDRFAARGRAAERPVGRDRRESRGERRLDALFDRTPRDRDDDYLNLEREIASDRFSDPAPERAPERASGRPVEPRDEPRAAMRPEPRVHPRSRAQIDDDLFEPSARSGRLRAFDGGLS